MGMDADTVPAAAARLGVGGLLADEGDAGVGVPVQMKGVDAGFIPAAEGRRGAARDWRLMGVGPFGRGFRRLSPETALSAMAGKVWTTWGIQWEVGRR